MTRDVAWEEANVEAAMEAMVNDQVERWEHDRHLESLGQGFEYWEDQWERSSEYECMQLEREVPSCQ